ncbi:MAG: glycosyltransferase family 1 protein [Spirochaetaceae bacterium]|nr:MAG: glycosyltransferase family 1 protein [Spirochaetaceae bacterium]
MSPDITVLAFYDRIGCFHTLRPFLTAPRDLCRRFHFTNSPDYCLKRDRNQILIMVRRFLKPDVVDMELMQRLRQKYRRIAFFHDDAGAAIPRLQVLPLVDLWYNKALFRDRSLYQRSLYGKELYTDYYHREFGITDPAPIERPVVSDPADLTKLRLSWNIGIGDFPKHTWRQRSAVAIARTVGIGPVPWFYHRSPFPARPARAPAAAAAQVLNRNRGLFGVHARMRLPGQPTLDYHRTLMLERITGHPDFLTGMVPQRRYNYEIRHSRITLSPFGWGELCFRDFEAVLSGSLLLKPDCSHLETWPDIFAPHQTYVPFLWDAADLVPTAEHYLTNEAARRRIAAAAYDTFREQALQVGPRFRAVIEEIAE